MIEDNKDKTPNTRNMGLSIALGAGLGVVLVNLCLITLELE